MTPHQQLISNLLRQTEATPHGTYAELQEDDQGAIWSYIYEVGHLGGRQAIRQAMELTDIPESYLPARNQYLIVDAHQTKLYCIAHTDSNYYLMIADGFRYYQLFLRGTTTTRTKAQREVGDLLRTLYSPTNQPQPLTE